MTAPIQSGRTRPLTFVELRQGKGRAIYSFP